MKTKQEWWESWSNINLLFLRNWVLHSFNSQCNHNVGSGSFLKLLSITVAICCHLIFKKITDDYKTKTEKLCSTHTSPPLKNVTLFSPLFYCLLAKIMLHIFNKFFSNDKENLLILILSSDRKFSIYNNSSVWENNVIQDENITPWPKRDRLLWALFLTRPGPWVFSEACLVQL